MHTSLAYSPSSVPESLCWGKGGWGRRWGRQRERDKGGPVFFLFSCTMPDTGLGLRPVVRKVSAPGISKDLTSRFERGSSSTSSSTSSTSSSGYASPFSSPSLSSSAPSKPSPALGGRPGRQGSVKGVAKTQVSRRRSPPPKKNPLRFRERRRSGRGGASVPMKKSRSLILVLRQVNLSRRQAKKKKIESALMI